jgi:hypothetical protein
VLGALIIKHIENLSDQKKIQAIQENIYMQFFVRLERFQTKQLFDASLFITIRKRTGKKEFDILNAKLIKNLSQKKIFKIVPKKKILKNPLQIKVNYRQTLLLQINTLDILLMLNY